MPYIIWNFRCFQNVNIEFFRLSNCSMCRDYVTEKLYWALNNDVVPIVMGGANYTLILPSDAYLNVEDYASPKALADHISHLLHNHTEYVKFFRWKLPDRPIWNQQTTSNFTERGDHGWCELCRLLNHPKRPNHTRTIVRNITDWWFRGQCRSFPVAKMLHAKRKPKFYE